METNNTLSIWTGQKLHFTGLCFLLLLTFLFWQHLESPSTMAFWLAVCIPIVHQLYVWLCWRLELNNSLISRTIGFPVYLVLFFVLFSGRFISLFYLAWQDQHSLPLSLSVQVLASLLCVLPGGYTMYSVHRYFGMVRASGADHFDPKYRAMPFVKQGMFRFTNNAMYLYAFLLFWAVAIGFSSSAALLVAAFSHAYIWLHYFCTEKPDIKYIYGAKTK